MLDEEHMESRSHGRYFAEYVRVTHEMDLQEQSRGRSTPRKGRSGILPAWQAVAGRGYGPLLGYPKA